MYSEYYVTIIQGSIQVIHININISYIKKKL